MAARGLRVKHAESISVDSHVGLLRVEVLRGALLRENDAENGLVQFTARASEALFMWTLIPLLSTEMIYFLLSS